MFCVRFYPQSKKFTKIKSFMDGSSVLSGLKKNYLPDNTIMAAPVSISPEHFAVSWRRI